jgi:energy-coupling factor transporter ATP-binding protein EcfA2
MSDKQGGLPGYRGFEYQIDASIWIALELMLHKEQIIEMLVEPDNAEDVEVMLTAPSRLPAKPFPQDSQTATVQVMVSTRQRMLYQMKTRSTGPWTDSAFKEVVGDGLESQKPKRGPTPRARALRMLLTDSGLSYMLLTDAGTDADLFSLSWSTLHPEGYVGVPSKDFFDATLRKQADQLAGRLLIMSNLTSELLGFRIAKLLTETAKVPHIRLAPCVDKLKDAFRQRLLGTAPALFKRDELLAILKAHEGLISRKDDLFYVPPIDLAAIEARLDRGRWIVLVGPPGAGKTMLATHLASSHRKGDPPFRVVWEHASLGRINEVIDVSGPTLTIVGDLWGTSSYVGESTFAHDLFGLIDTASPDKRFIITARSDIYAKVPEHVRDRIANNVVEFSEKNYGADLLWKIVERSSGANDAQLNALAPMREEILQRLVLPSALRKFAAQLDRDAMRIVLPSADGDEVGANLNRHLVTTWIAEAEAATRGTHVRELLKQWHDDVGEHATLLWLMSEATEVIEIDQLRSVASNIRRETKVKLKPVEFVEFLSSNELASVANGEVRIHSVVLESLASIVRSRPSMADEFAIAFLSSILEQTRDDGLLGRMERIAGVIRTLYSEPEAQADGWSNLVDAFDRAIVESCQSSEQATFRQGVYTGMWLPWTNSPFVRLLHCLGPDESDTTPPWYGSVPLQASVEEAKRTGLLEEFLPRFVAEFVPLTSICYAYEPTAFADYVQRFNVELEDAARTGLALMERNARTPVPEHGFAWEPDHNAPALLDLLPAAEKLNAGKQLGWNLETCVVKSVAYSLPQCEWRRRH